MAKKKVIKCDMCGKEFDYWDKNQNFILENSFHYGSRYDLGYVKVHLCIDCMDKMFTKVFKMFDKNPLKFIKTLPDGKGGFTEALEDYF